MTKDVNLDQLQKDAVEIFNQGFACSESIIYAIKKNFELEMSDDAIAMSSGFPWGDRSLTAVVDIGHCTGNGACSRNTAEEWGKRCSPNPGQSTLY